MIKNNLFYLIILVLLIWNTYTGFKKKRSIIISFLTSILLLIGGVLFMLPFLLYFYFLPNIYELDLSWWLLTPLTIIYSVLSILFGVFIATPFWSIHDNYIDSGKFKILNFKAFLKKKFNRSK